LSNDFFCRGQLNAKEKADVVDSSKVSDAEAADAGCVEGSRDGDKSQE
jgi:hypothetical protein